MTGISRSKLFTTVAAACLATPLMVGAALAADPVPQNDLLNATLWVSNSVEYKANTLSMFSALAKTRLDEALANPASASALDQTDASGKPPAIVADVDETLFDNGGYEIWLIQAGQGLFGQDLRRLDQGARGQGHARRRRFPEVRKFEKA